MTISNMTTMEMSLTRVILVRYEEWFVHVNKGGYLWEQHNFTSERGAKNKYIELLFCVLRNFLWAKLHSNLTASLHWLNCISSLMLVLMFIGDIVEMDRDKKLTHSSSQICTRSSNETMTPITTHTSSEIPSNVRSQIWSDTSRDYSVLYWDIGMCLKFMHM